MSEKRFDPKKLQKLNNPQRLVDIPPDYVADKLAVKRPDVMVEIGAGTAFFSVAFFRLFTPSTLYACDVSETVIDWVEKNIVPGHPRIVPVKTEADTVPLDDGIADLLFMINLHHELDHPLQTIETSHRLLKPGGEIFVVDWKRQEMAEGPPQEIRVLPEHVRDQLIQSGFGDVCVYDELAKHFLVVGKK